VADVVRWAQQFVDDEDAFKLWEQKVDVEAIFEFDVDSLVACNIRRGPATKLAKQINILKTQTPTWSLPAKKPHPIKIPSPPPSPHATFPSTDPSLCSQQTPASKKRKLEINEPERSSKRPKLKKRTLEINEPERSNKRPKLKKRTLEINEPESQVKGQNPTHTKAIVGVKLAVQQIDASVFLVGVPAQVCVPARTAKTQMGGFIPKFPKCLLTLFPILSSYPRAPN